MNVDHPVLHGAGVVSVASQHDVPEVVAEAVSCAGWPGWVLDATRVFGRSVYAVIELTTEGSARLDGHDEPVLYRPTLAAWEDPTAITDAQGPDPGQPVRIVGLVATRPWRAAVRSLAWLGGYGAGLVAMTRPVRRIEAMEADFLGLTVVGPVGGSALGVTVRGRPGPVTGSVRSVATRVREEMLYSILLECAQKQ